MTKITAKTKQYMGVKNQDVDIVDLIDIFNTEASELSSASAHVGNALANIIRAYNPNNVLGPASAHVIVGTNLRDTPLEDVHEDMNTYRDAMVEALNTLGKIRLKLNKLK